MQQLVTKKMIGILAGTMLLMAVVAIALPKAEAIQYKNRYGKGNSMEVECL